MNKRVTIDPVTRIEGHLRVDVEVDGGRVKKAWASGQMWRGVENILIGRDPRDAWAITQRICGVCTTVHAMASVRAVENALQLEIPINIAYGSLKNYEVPVFSPVEIAKSTDYKFKDGIICYKASVFTGGNVVGFNGFLRVKKGATTSAKE
jgi:hypothetical protein